MGGLGVIGILGAAGRSGGVLARPLTGGGAGLLCLLRLSVRCLAGLPSWMGWPLLSSLSDWSDFWPGSLGLFVWLPVWLTLLVDWACTQAPPTVIRVAASSRAGVFMVLVL